MQKRDLRGVRAFRGEDLTGLDLAGIDGRGIDLRGCTGSGVDLRCANLRGAKLGGVQMDRWLLTGAQMDECDLSEALVDFNSHLEAVDLRGATFDQTRFEVNGWRSRGILMDDFPADSLIGAYDNNHAVCRFVRSQFPGDDDMYGLICFSMASPWVGGAKLPCWEGVVIWARERLPNRIDELLDSFRAHPRWKLAERWEIAEAVVDCEDPETLRDHRLYPEFRRHCENMIRERRR
jgi:hypothetical protein